MDQAKASMVFHQYSAAEAADRILAGELEKPDGYDASFRSGINRYLLDRRNMYALERRFESSPFWQRRHEQTEEI